MADKIVVFEKEYDGESLYDLDRDISEAMLEEYNDKVGQIPTNADGFQTGKFKVTVVWEDR
ncbi:hypothetical protein DLP05_128 [Stenotrophomonas phage vB_SmaS_DLP_5]|uniref:Uncharacterized protein n=1 Tax=Stenotrophomonas phage vB_SmaS_DLP_5 TaxID=2044561 RepID=A0A2D2W2N1_9CAUD|nr:hypothetical protein FDJ07_gp093 [Stenotrophomonas phage vB_SmaS_DLP_5]ATS92402.1 hypothetical protein DLP05_128 [Stenotrophomonas phage vB_SmaS_DLP_5]